MNYLFLSSFGQTMSYIGYIALAILILLVMITVHEFGHYIAGKIFSFGIDEFAIGFGPKLFSKKKKNGELVSLRAFISSSKKDQSTVLCPFLSRTIARAVPHPPEPKTAIFIYFSFLNEFSSPFINLLIFSL